MTFNSFVIRHRKYLEYELFLYPSVNKHGLSVLYLGFCGRGGKYACLGMKGGQSPPVCV